MVSNHSLLPNCQTDFQYFSHLFTEKSPQVVSSFNSTPNAKAGWRLFSKVFQQNSWMWQVFMFGSAFAMYYVIYIPLVAIYQTNNVHRTYEAAMTKEKAHKKKLK